MGEPFSGAEKLSLFHGKNGSILITNDRYFRPLPNAESFSSGCGDTGNKGIDHKR
jgi:hypothetical protein